MKRGIAIRGLIVFEGNAPADVRENHLLNQLVEKGRGGGREATRFPPPPAGRRVAGSVPNSIKGPTEALFKRQSGSNLLVVGQSEERNSTILSVSLVALAAQFSKDAAQFFVL